MKSVIFFIFTVFSAIHALPRTIPAIGFGLRVAHIVGEFKLWGFTNAITSNDHVNDAIKGEDTYNLEIILNSASRCLVYPFGYTEHTYAFCTRIGLDKKKLIKINLGTDSTLVFSVP
jgi:hypothetical protein